MANTKSAQKAMRQAERRARRNRGARSAVRTFVKKANTAVARVDQDAAAVAVREAIRALDKAAQKGIIHRNAASRRKSRLSGRLHRLSQTPPDSVSTTPAAPEPKGPGTRAPTRRTAPKAATADKKPAAPRPRAPSGSSTRKATT